jgi:hypothetical protein
MFNDREIASAFWLIAAFGWALSQPGIRHSLVAVGRALLQPAMLATILAFAAWIGAIVALAAAVGLWNRDLAKDTSLWFVLSGLALVLNPDHATDEAFFRHTVVSAIGITAFLEFYGNLFVLPLGVELVLQPTLVLIVLLRAVAGHKPEFKAVKTLIDGLSASIGLVLLALVSLELAQGWNTLDKAETVRSLALPVWLTVGSLPVIYLLSLYLGYESALLHGRFATSDRRALQRMRLALILGFRGSHRDIGGFAGAWPARLASASSLTDALRVIGRYRARLRAKKAIERRQAARLKRYAGVQGTDALGRQLDRREFKATQLALESLGTYQGAWYWHHDRRYGPNLLDLFNDFTHEGLPIEHGISMKVRGDGQAWFASRRCVGGWCFAIGNAGPPLRDWRYDGPTPPRGYPSKNSTWLDGAAARDANWYAPQLS